MGPDVSFEEFTFSCGIPGGLDGAIGNVLAFKLVVVGSIPTCRSASPGMLDLNYLDV